MATAFQSTAFQNNAFQIDGGAVVVAAVRTGGGGIQPKRRKTLRLPFKPTGFGGYRKKKNDLEKRLEERLEQSHADAVEIAEAGVRDRSDAQAAAALQAAIMGQGVAAQAAMNAEISRLLRERMRQDEEDTQLIMLIAQAIDDED